MKTISFPSQRGITLIETLVALMVTALGILGILGLQMRTMADTQTGVRQAQAIRLVENLSERVRMNPNAISDTVAAAYTIDWGQLPGSDASLPECTASAPCNAVAQAQSDVQQWKRSIQGDSALPGNLPLADAKVFFVNDEAGRPAGERRQLGVMISWRENESSASNNDNSYLRYFRLDSTDSDGNTVNCPANSSCYLQFIQLPSRCVANRDAGPGQLRYYCADGSAKELQNSP